MSRSIFASILPPLMASSPVIPAIPADTDWDTDTLGPNINWDRIPQERRHSGWAEVERRWTACQEAGSSFCCSSKKRRRLHNEQADRLTQQQREVVVVKEDEEQDKEEGEVSFPDPHLSILPPNLMSDFRMKVTLDSESEPGSKRTTTTFAEGSWSGNLGRGSVAGGSQETQDIVCGKMRATQIEATHRLQTRDDPPAYIECKTRGFRTGPPEDDDAAAKDPRLGQYRVFISMRTADERYAEKVNFGMWVGCCLRRGRDVVYDAYRIS
ncbi:hypothetical protein F4810DRAFT_125759 [Camillea tinctor]|nr:hypothetical protein F4810DRAFT_125759 [Camillea tinctor]